MYRLSPELAHPAGPRDQFTPAVRADMAHPAGTPRTEGALVRADERRPISRERDVAALAPVAHLEGHCAQVDS